ncbi:MAG: helix-turn-helix domain-containing protein [Desulfovibrionaceae bacterium]|nr:helix-turn-helix domain-containing protein [Desulfovibrionaceae bacterium]
MTLEEFGACLREAREQRALSLEAVSSKLKISSRVIRALEEGDTSNFPHVAYAKGFLRSYGNFLGLNAEDIAQAVALISRGMSHETSSNLETVSMPGGGLGRFLPQVIVMVLFFGIIGGMGYLIWQRGYIGQALDWINTKTASLTTKPSTDPGKTNAQIPAPLGQVAPTPKVAPKPEVQPKPENPLDALHKVDPISTTPRASLVEEGASTQVPAKPVPQVETTPVPPAPQPIPQPAPPQGTLQQVIIVATEPCWVHSSADKTEVRQFSLRKGETFALSFREQLELKLGNAGGVRFRFNGKDIPPVGKPGQVRTVTFPSGEVQ